MLSMSLSKLLEAKLEAERELVGMFSEYIYKYVKKQYRNSETYIDFQKELIKNSKWSDEKVMREYEKFLKFLRKSSEELEYMMKNFLILCIRVLSYGYDSNAISLQIPRMEHIFYKGVRRVSKYYFENPKEKILVDFKVIGQMLLDYIPFEKLLNLLETSFINNKNIHYNFDTHTDTSHHTLHHTDTSHHTDHTDTSHVSKPNDNGITQAIYLRYVPSDELNEINYSLQLQGQINEEDAGSNSSDVRYITVRNARAIL